MEMLEWNRYTPSYVSRRYNRLAVIYPVFELIFGLPRGIRKQTIESLKLNHGDTVLEIGCGTGRNLLLLSNAAGKTGKVYGVDVSEKMLGKAHELIAEQNLDNVELVLSDAGKYHVGEKLDAVLFSLSYATMLGRKEVLKAAWEKLKPGGKVVIMDAQFPPGLFGKLITPIKPAVTLFLKASVLGNPNIKPIEELSEITGVNVDVKEISFKTYFIASAVKP